MSRIHDVLERFLERFLTRLVERSMMSSLFALALALTASSACTILMAGRAPCADDGDCGAGESCIDAFCAPASVDRAPTAPAAPSDPDPQDPEDPEDPPPVSDEGPPFFDERFAARRPLALHPFFDELVEDLPVTVELTAAGGWRFADARADGVDVVFVDHAVEPAALLPFERSEYRDGYALFFVRLAAFDSAGGDVWIYFGDDGASEAQDIASTWAGHHGVWHFDDENAPNALSFAKERISDVAAVDGDVFPGMGFMGTAGFHRAFDMGLRSSVELSLAPLSPASGGSISFVMAEAGVSSGGSGNESCLMFDVDGVAEVECAHVLFIGDDDDGQSFDADSFHVTWVPAPSAPGNGYLGVFAPTTPSSGNFLALQSAPISAVDEHVVTVAWGTGFMELWIDGSVVDSASLTVQADFALERLFVGAHTVPLAGSAFSGVVDELRVLPAAPSQAYIHAEQLAHMGELVSLGDVEVR